MVYVEGNPVRAGLVERAADIRGPARACKFGGPQRGREALETSIEDEEFGRLQEASRRGRPFRGQFVDKKPAQRDLEIGV